MRILWVKVGGLWPLNAGGRLRSFHLLRELSERHRVTLLTTHGPDESADDLARHLPQTEVLSFGHAVPKKGSARFAIALSRSWLSPQPVDLWRWRVPDLRSEAARRLASHSVDVCVADFLAGASNVPFDSTVPIVLFEHNVEHMIWQRLARIERWSSKRALLEIEWRKMRRAEARACAASRLTLAVSDADRAALAALSPATVLRSVQTGVDTTYFRPNGARTVGPALVFTGSMDWYPNEDAILHFTDSILPAIRQAVPEVAFSIVGRNPTARLRVAAERAGARVTGTVDDVRPFMEEGAVHVVPLRVGGGTRLKIFEALAMRQAVVSTSVGAEGLPIVPGVHFLQADDPRHFGHEVVSLLRDPERRRALGAAGRQLVEQQYSWTRVARDFETACQEVMTHAG